MPLLKKSWLVLSLAGTALFLILFLARVKNEMHDFQVNYTAGLRLGQGETIYRPWKPDPGWENDGHWQFKYSPFSAILYLPLSFLPLTAAKGVWYILVLVSIGVLAGVSLRLAAFDTGKAVTAAVLSFLVLGRYFLRELQLGQINALITAVLMLMTVFLIKQEKATSPGAGCASGLLWGLATALKPYAVIFFAYFILKRKWKTLAAGLVFLAASFCVPVLFYGIRGNAAVHREWITSLSESTPSLFTSQDNVSLLAFFSKWTGNRPAAAALFGIGIGVLAILTMFFIFRGKNVRKPVFMECALLILFIPLLSPLGWDYTFLAAFPAIVIIFRAFGAFPKPWKILLALDFAVIAFSLYDLLGRRFYGQFMSWSVPTINFIVLAAAFFYLRLKRIS